MANYSALIKVINNQIKANGNQEITGPVLNAVLRAMVSALGEGYQFMGIATPDTNPGTPDGKVFYIATEPGVYSNFGGIEIESYGVYILENTGGTWSLKEVISVDSELSAESLRPLQNKAVSESIARINEKFSLSESIVDDESSTKVVDYFEQATSFTIKYPSGIFSGLGFSIGEVSGSFRHLWTKFLSIKNSDDDALAAVSKVLVQIRNKDENGDLLFSKVFDILPIHPQSPKDLFVDLGEDLSFAGELYLIIRFNALASFVRANVSTNPNSTIHGVYFNNGDIEESSIGKYTSDKYESIFFKLYSSLTLKEQLTDEQIENINGRISVKKPLGDFILDVASIQGLIPSAEGEKTRHSAKNGYYTVDGEFHSDSSYFTDIYDLNLDKIYKLNINSSKSDDIATFLIFDEKDNPIISLHSVWADKLIRPAGFTRIGVLRDSNTTVHELNFRQVGLKPIEFFEEESEDKVIRDAYEQGLLDIFINKELFTDITYLGIRGYVGTGAPRLFCVYKTDGSLTYFSFDGTNNVPFSSIENNRPIYLEKDGIKVGYVVFRDKQKFIDNPTNRDKGLDLSKVMGNEWHSHVWMIDYFNLEKIKELSGIKTVAENDKKVISKESLPASVVNPTVKPEPIEISLPDKIYAVVGDTLQLFYRGMIQAVDPYRYNILVSCSKGKQYPRYFEYLPVTGDVGTTDFTITVKDDNRNVLSTKTCQLVTVDVVKSPTSNLKVLCFGDSLTTNGEWCREADRRLTETEGTPAGNGLTNIDFSGSKKKETTGYFGVGGWEWRHYTTEGLPAYRFEVTGVTALLAGVTYTNNGHMFKIMEINVTEGNGNILCAVESLEDAPESSGVLTKASSGFGDGTITFTSASPDSRNPLWDYEEGKMTFIPYANRVSGGQIDVVYTLLTWNGLRTAQTDFSEELAQMKIFANTLHAEFPNAKLKIMGVQVPSVRGGMGANYGASGKSYADGYGMVVTALNMNKFYQEFANDEEYSSFVEFVNVSSQFDTEYMMPHNEKAVNTRSTVKEWMDTNGIDLSNEGYLQIGDVVYRNFIANFCQ